MTSAIHIEMWRTIDPVEAGKSYGNDRSPSDPHKPNFLCTICLTGMHLVKPAALDRVPFFSHFDHADCEAILRNRMHYQHLQAVDPIDIQTVLQRRAAFVGVWPYIFQRMRDIVPLLSYHKFIDAAEQADKIGIWRYRNFDLNHLPYNFVLLKDFHPDGGLSSRKEHIRFWVAPGRVGAYWMWPQTPGVLIRGHFRTGSFSRPVRSKDLITSHLIDTAINLQATQIPHLSENLKSAIVRRLKEIGY